MGVVLEAIKFNHDPNTATHDALNIRRNATEVVTVPEWRRGVSVKPEDSPAAYSIADTAGHVLTIEASFSRTDSTPNMVFVRALDADGSSPDEPGCIGFIFRFLFLLAQAVSGNVLGSVKARKVHFSANGQTGFVTFQLKNVRIGRVGVGARTTTWRWQYRVASRGSWTTFATTTHRIYTLLEIPKSPWQQVPSNSINTQVPWAEVLDYACAWASLTTTRDAAAGAVTRAIYDLAPSVITYDCPGGGSTHYGGDCTALLERLAGGIGNGYYVNCSDCASIVSTFANALGCDLWQSRMDSFDLLEMRALGSPIWETPCGWPAFAYHEVAWKGACDVNDEVFDACVQVDGDADPTLQPHTALLPVNMRFGNPGDGRYRDRIATPASRPGCIPIPSTRTRRPVY